MFEKYLIYKDVDLHKDNENTMDGEFYWKHKENHWIPWLSF